MLYPTRPPTGFALELENLEQRLQGEPHEILGVGANATNSEACTAFIELSRAYHPRRFASADPRLVRRAAVAYRRLRSALAAFARRAELTTGARRRAHAPTEPSVIPDPDLDLVGGRYMLERELGEGGMGRVFEARHLQLGKKFALKIINRSRCGSTLTPNSLKVRWIAIAGLCVFWVPWLWINNKLLQTM